VGAKKEREGLMAAAVDSIARHLLPRARQPLEVFVVAMEEVAK
jgi:hypothetical protein